MWNRHRRPPPDVCPEKYCFLWVPPGGAKDMTRRLYDSVDEPLSAHDCWTHFPEGGCGCSFGPCRRASGAPPGAPDFYEPCEPTLAEDGLPRLYFCRKESLVASSRRAFERMAVDLWGGEDSDDGSPGDAG